MLDEPNEPAVAAQGARRGGSGETVGAGRTWGRPSADVLLVGGMARTGLCRHLQAGVWGGAAEIVLERSKDTQPPVLGSGGALIS